MLTDDAVNFNKYLETVLAASAPPPGSNKQTQSPWLFLDAAHTIFDTAKRRVYTGKLTEKDLAGNTRSLPDALRPVLEEQPKWSVLAEVLEEIERDVYFNPTPSDDSNGSVLIMCGSTSTCRQIREYLQSMHVHFEGQNGEDLEDPDLKPTAAVMMRRKLRNYLEWKREFARVSANLYAENEKEINGVQDHRGNGSHRGNRAPANKRRRIRGGGAATSAPTRTASGSIHVAGDKDSHVASLMAELQPTDAEMLQKGEVVADPLEGMEDYFELYDMRDLIVVHPYDGDLDEHVLEETRPRYVIMYEPDAAFIRRIEVYRSSHTDRNVRVYFVYYGGSVEEQRYLSAVRREKDSFTRLIRERGVRTLSLLSRAGFADSYL